MLFFPAAIAVVKSFAAPLIASAAWRAATSKRGIVVIVLAVLVVSNVVTGVYWHMRGANGVLATCKTAALVRRNAELSRDVSIAVDLSLSQMAQDRIRAERDAAREKEIAGYEVEQKPRPDCTVPRGANVWMRQDRY